MKNECGLTRPSVVMLEQIRTIDKKKTQKVHRPFECCRYEQHRRDAFCKVLEFRGAANANRHIISRVTKMPYNILRNCGGDSTWKISITQMRWQLQTRFG